MSGAKEPLQLLLLFFGWGGFGGVRANALAAGVVLRCGEAAFAHMLGRIGGIAFVYTRRAQILVEPPFAITACHKRPASAFCKLGVVDIAQIGKLADQCIYVCGAVVTPSTFTDFAIQICGKLGPGGRIFANIM